jgi:hypothetical protein
MIAEDFSRALAYAFGDHDATALAALVAHDGTCLTLTGGWAESREAAEVLFQGEFTGIFARARLVSGKGSVLPLGPGLSLLRQRFVVSGALSETGAELPRFGAQLVAVLMADGPDMAALSLNFSAVHD